MSLNVETYEERQENELLALQSIFGDDVQDLRECGVWKTWQPLEVKITLFPQQGSPGLAESHAKIDLHVKCGEMYPDVEPVVKLEKSRGISDKLVLLLQEELDKIVKEHKGEVMIFDLSHHIQEFLFKHSRKEFTNLWEEMHNRREQKQQEIFEEKKRIEAIEQQHFKDEIQRRKEMLKTEPRLKRLSVNENEIHLLHPGIERMRANSRKRCSSESSDGSLCEHRGIKLIHFDIKGERKIHRGRCIGHSERGSILYSGIDSTTGEIVTITEWHIKLQNPNNLKLSKNHELPELQQCVKQIASIEQELNFLMKLKHINLVNYLNLKYAKENDTFVVYILQEFVVGINCSSLFLTGRFSIEIDMLRHFAEGILSALDFLHRNNVIHRDLRDSCVFIDQTGLIKLSDYSLDKRLHELTTKSMNRNHSKRTDIYKFGLLMLSLLHGCSIEEISPKIPEALPEDLKDFLYRCISSDERSRWSTTQLLKHGFIRHRLERCSPARSLDDSSVLGPGGDVSLCHKSPEDNPEDDDGDLKTFIPIQTGGQSRIQNEFEILKWLGKGAYGDVLKVRNKLDDRNYAIKRIPLDPKNKHLNKKITREVKLLSRLNHENVVRYYNSWIESATIDTPSSKELTDQKTSPEIEVIKRGKDKKDEFKGFPGDDIELLAPPIRDVEWSISYESKSKSGVQSAAVSSDEETFDDDDDDDDDDDWDFVPDTDPASDSSDSIEFEKDSGNTDSEFQQLADSPKTSTTPTKNENENVLVEQEECCIKEIQFMYIQMEFCEKSTLRNAIDNELHKDTVRVWRLFREIVEGLSHIHQQGMIHRDLKPVNIFLDSNDHVKIGDFGLATTNILSRRAAGIESLTKNVYDVRESYNQEIPSITADGSLTGQVGTALYSAPELNATANKAIYNQKVDIYSLGIILFEMVYIPLKTAMERVTVLFNLRQKDINFPQDFCDVVYEKFKHVVRWLLNHDPGQRPTSQELLQSDFIPPPVIEEYELQEVVRHTLANTQSKAYRYLITSCFEQDITPAEDITYDMNIVRGKLTLYKSLLLQEQVKAKIIKVFKLHGGQFLTTPLLMPKSKYYDSTESCVRMMTYSGEIVMIPHDLRVFFARYVAWNGLTNIKRYAIERVYREKKALRFHPSELYECAFDIITPTFGNFLAEAELLSIVYEIIQEFPGIRNKNFIIRLNHTSLLKGILMHCGIEEEKHNDVYSILTDGRDGKLSKFQIQTHLISLCLSDQSMKTLFNLIEMESPITDVKNKLRTVTRCKGEASNLVKQGLKDLEMITQNAEFLGVKSNIVIAPGLVYNVQQYFGMMCQFVCELKRKRRKGGMDVLAAGGRYDKMLADFRSKLVKTDMEKNKTQQFGAGISISLDKLIQALQEDQPSELTESVLDVVVTSTGSKPMLYEKCQVLRDLWMAGIRCTLIDSNSLLDIQEQCLELNVNVIVVLSDKEQNTLRVQTWERDRFQDSKININEVVDYVNRVLKNTNDNSNETFLVSTNQLVRSESRSSSFCSDVSYSSSNALPPINFRFILPDKLVPSVKRRYENQISTELFLKLQKISSRTKVEVLVSNLESTVIRTLVSCLELESNNIEFEKCVCTVIERHPHCKKHLKEVCDIILELKTEKSQPVIVLCNFSDHYFRILL